MLTTFVNNFCEQLLLTTFVKHFCEQLLLNMLRETFVRKQTDKFTNFEKNFKKRHVTCDTWHLTYHICSSAVDDALLTSLIDSWRAYGSILCKQLGLSMTTTIKCAWASNWLNLFLNHPDSYTTSDHEYVDDSDNTAKRILVGSLGYSVWWSWW